MIISLLCPGMHSDTPHRHVVCWAVGEQSVTHQTSEKNCSRVSSEGLHPTNLPPTVTLGSLSLSEESFILQGSFIKSSV